MDIGTGDQLAAASRDVAGAFKVFRDELRRQGFSKRETRWLTQNYFVPMLIAQAAKPTT